MKRILLIVTVILLNVCAQAQTIKQEAPLSAKWTNSAKQLSQKEFANISISRFKNVRSYGEGVKLFQDGNALVAFVENELKPTETYSFDEKLNFYQSSAQRPNSQLHLKGHEIKNVGTRKVLVVNYELNGDGFYTFFSELYDGNKYLFGHVQYLPKDSASAKAAMSNMFPKNQANARQ